MFFHLFTLNLSVSLTLKWASYGQHIIGSYFLSILQIFAFTWRIDPYVYVYTMDSFSSVQFSSVAQSCPTLCDPMNQLQHARPPCPSPTPGVHSNSSPSSWWCHPAISSSVIPFSFCPQSLPASGAFPMSRLFAWGGQSIGVSALASVLPVNTQDWSPLG